MRLTHILILGKLILALLLSYSLGSLSMLDKHREPVKITYTEPEIVQIEEDEGEGGKSLVASKNGTKFYYIWCSGVARIKDENKVYFNTKNEALNKGFSPAKNCPGL
jgi:hypothetical protein